MAKTKISEWSQTAASNTDIDGITLAEGVMTPSGVNNALRELMSQLADLYAGATSDKWAVAAGGTGSQSAAGARVNLAVSGLADNNTFTGTNTFTGFTRAATFTAESLTVMGSAIPANGVYLPSANTLGFAANSANLGVWGSTGLVVGNTSAVAGASSQTPLLQSHGVVSLGAFRWSASAGGANVTLAHSRSATVGTQSAVTTADQLGALNFQGSDGTSFISGSVKITGLVDAAVSTGIVPGRMVLETQNTSGTIVERLRVDSGGQIILGNSQGGALATNATALMPAMPSCAGAATGIPAVSYTGFCPFIYDTTNNKLYIYNQVGAAWKSVQLA